LMVQGNQIECQVVEAEYYYVGGEGHYCNDNCKNMHSTKVVRNSPESLEFFVS